MTEEMTMDSVLDEVGHCGPYQLRLMLLVLPPVLASAIFHAQYVFAALDPDYRCLVPECEARPPRWEAGEWAAWALPPAPASRCQRRTPVGADCRRESFSTTLQDCDSWIYRNNDSIISEFELACQPWKKTMAGTVHSLGVFTALLFVGICSDSFGRRITFILTASIPSLVGLARSWAPSFGWYLVLEYVSATVGAGVYGTGFVLVMETLGARSRVMGGSMLSITYALGEALLALLSWAVPYWRTRTRLLYGPTILFLTYYFCLDESLRWLLSKGKKTQAIRLMQKMAAQNGKTLQLDKAERLAGALDGPAGVPPLGGRAVIGEVMRSRRLRARVLVCSYCWITCTFVYYGLSINSVTLAGNLYANYALTALVELPGVLLSVALLDRFGRRRTIMASLLVCGTSLLVFSCMPSSQGGLGAGLALLGKTTVSLATNSNYIHASEMFPTPARNSLLGVCALVSRLGMAAATLSPLLVVTEAAGPSLGLTLAAKAGVSLAFVSLYVFTTELFPTNARHSLLNLCSFVGRMGAIAAPLSPLLAEVKGWLPYLVFGCLALTAALLLLLTPETLHMRLPDTVQDAEHLARAPRRSTPPALAEPPAAAAATEQNSNKR